MPKPVVKPTRTGRAQCRTVRLPLHLKLLLLLAPLLLCACALPRYAELQLPATPSASFVSESKPLLIVLESVIQDRPLIETVWDNISGPLWDPAESQRIGFTQQYQLPAGVSALQPARVGLFALQPTYVISSRIMFPFGRLFANALERQAAIRGTPATICTDKICTERAESGTAFAQKLVIRIEAAAVAETRLNRITQAVRVSCTTGRYPAEQRSQSFSVQLADRSVAEYGLFHSDFVRAMNGIAIEFADKVAGAILDGTPR